MADGTRRPGSTTCRTPEKGLGTSQSAFLSGCTVTTLFLQGQNVALMKNRALDRVPGDRVPGDRMPAGRSASPPAWPGLCRRQRRKRPVQ